MSYVMTGRYRPVTKQDDNYIWQDGYEWEFECTENHKTIWRRLKVNEI